MVIIAKSFQFVKISNLSHQNKHWTLLIVYNLQINHVKRTFRGVVKFYVRFLVNNVHKQIKTLKYLDFLYNI